MIAFEEKKIRQKLIFLNSIRIAILAALILVSAAIFLFFNISFSIVPIIGSLLAAILVSILFFPLSRWRRLKLLIFLQLGGDILLITLLVYFSGGIISPFYFLYILPIIVSAIFLSRRETIYVATFSFVTFGGLSDLLYLRIIPFSPAVGYNHVTLQTFIYNLLMGFIAFASVAVLSSYYFERIKKTGEELRHIQENLQDLILLNSSVMEKMENGFITADPNGRVVTYNEKAAALLGVGGSHNVFDLLLSPVDLQKVREISAEHNRYYFERNYRGWELGVSVSLLERISGFERLYVFLITDLTEIKKIERQLKEKENLALIGQMLAGIAHEIRNPLASISGSVQFLRQELKLAPDYQNLMSIVVKESERLSRSLEDILNFSKTKTLNIAEFDLVPLVDEVLEMVTRNYPEVRFYRKYSPGHDVRADRERIQRLVWNIITNALKAVGDSGEIEITVYRHNGAVILSIRDNGVGMSREEMARMFTPFFSRFTAGIGLGMFLVKRIVDDHGFRIDIQSEKNKGTEVSVCFRKQ